MISEYHLLLKLSGNTHHFIFYSHFLEKITHQGNRIFGTLISLPPISLKDEHEFLGSVFCMSAMNMHKHSHICVHNKTMHIGDLTSSKKSKVQELMRLNSFHIELILTMFQWVNLTTHLILGCVYVYGHAVHAILMDLARSTSQNNLS